MNWRTDSAPDSNAPVDRRGHLPVENTREAEVLSWEEICQSAEYGGRWVALDACRYDAASGRATAGQVIDVDDDLHELCQRVRENDLRSCAIVFCEPHRGSAVPN